MTITIPFSVEGEAKECSIELRDLADRQVLAEIFRGRCEPGVHDVSFDTESLHGSLDAGIYILHVVIGEEVSVHAVQYMP